MIRRVLLHLVVHAIRELNAVHIRFFSLLVRPDGFVVAPFSSPSDYRSSHDQHLQREYADSHEQGEALRARRQLAHMRGQGSAVFTYTFST